MAAELSWSYTTYLILLFSITVHSKDFVPVLLWNSDSVVRGLSDVPALERWDSLDFEEHVVNKIHSPLVVLFPEQSISIEDFSWRNSDGDDSFPKLEKIVENSHGAYLSAVEGPVGSLRGLRDRGYKWQHINTSDIPDIGFEPTVLVVHLEDPFGTEDRPTFLRRHDAAIASFCEKLKEKYPNFLAIYTGHHTSWTGIDDVSRRGRRTLAEDTVSEDGFLFCNVSKQKNILLFSSQPIFNYRTNSQDIVSGTLEGSYTCTGDVKNTSASLTVSYGKQNVSGETFTSIALTFQFTILSSGYWALQNVTVLVNPKPFNDTTIRLMNNDTIAPFGFSYFCNKRTSFVSETSDPWISLNFAHLQVQPFGDASKFSRAYDCLGFFSAGIWSGIFVTIILAFIIAWGLCMVMDIKTMDRFDDPKGKPITVAATD